MTIGTLSEVAVIGIDIGKNTFHAIGLNQRGSDCLAAEMVAAADH